MKHINHILCFVTPFNVGFKTYNQLNANDDLYIPVDHYFIRFLSGWQNVAWDCVDNPTIQVWSGRSTMMSHPSRKFSNVWNISHKTLLWCHVYLLYSSMTEQSFNVCINHCFVWWHKSHNFTFCVFQSPFVYITPSGQCTMDNIYHKLQCTLVVCLRCITWRDCHSCSVLGVESYIIMAFWYDNIVWLC